MISIYKTSFIASSLFIFFSQNVLAELPTADCPLLKSAEVLAIFPASKNELLSKVRDKPFTSCSFIWKSSTVQVKELLGHKVEIPGESRLTITRVAVRSKGSDWQRVITSYGSQSLIDVQNIGDKAIWSAKRHQLSLLTDKYVIHVAVEDPDQADAEQKNAEQISLLLLNSQ